MALKKGRVLTGTHIEGIRYECDDVVQIEAGAGKALADVLDMTPAAVEYAEKILGKVAKQHSKGD